MRCKSTTGKLKKNNKLEEFQILENLRSGFEATLDELSKIRNASLSRITAIFSIIETTKHLYSEKQLDSLILVASIVPI
tara:strand:+ start:2190 stop:2426 length:237 start_codon:yes stop_codon:yes gene_type:complete